MPPTWWPAATATPRRTPPRSATSTWPTSRASWCRPRRSAEGETVGLGARVEERDLGGAVRDVLLANQLVEPPVADLAVPVGAGVRAGRRGRWPAVEQQVEAGRA